MPFYVIVSSTTSTTSSHPHIGRIIPAVLFTPLPNPPVAHIDDDNVVLGCWGVSQVTLVALPPPNGLICVDCVHCVENEGCIIIIIIY